MLPVLLTVLEWLLYYVILSLKIYVHILTNGAAFLSFMAVATCFAPFYFGPATVWRVLATGFTKIKVRPTDMLPHQCPVVLMKAPLGQQQPRCTSAILGAGTMGQSYRSPSQQVHMQPAASIIWR